MYKVSSSVILLQIMSKGEIILNQSTVTYSVWGTCSYLSISSNKNRKTNEYLKRM